MSEPKPQIAIIGDLHSAWDGRDVQYFNRSNYELLLFTGDLGGKLAGDGLAIARSIASLRRPALVMLGNNDVPFYASISAELTYQRGLSQLMSSLGPSASGATLARTCGFSLHCLSLSGLEVTLIAARPFAMGGSECSYADALSRSYGVGSLDESRDRLRQLIDGVTTEHVLFLAHNGPTGLGARPNDIWGRDFGDETGDWGDRDLTDAVAYARERGRVPLAVIAGHMHWSPERRTRNWHTHHNGTLYVNAACVPRAPKAGTSGGSERVHFALTLSPDRAHIAQVRVPSDE